MLRLFSLHREVDDSDRHLLHILIDESIAILTGTNSERDAEVTDREPKQPAVQKAKKIRIVNAEAVGSIGKISTAPIQKEPWSFADIGENNLWTVKYWVVCYLILDLIPCIPPWFSSHLIV